MVKCRWLSYCMCYRHYFGTEWLIFDFFSPLQISHVISSKHVFFVICTEPYLCIVAALYIFIWKYIQEEWCEAGQLTLFVFLLFYFSYCYYTEKNLRWIINPEKGFITENSVYQHALPFDKPFFLEKTDKGLSPVANRYTLVLVSLLINPFSIDQQNQP
jgi:hypothetical protein